MNKTKRFERVIVALLVFSMMVTYSVVPSANAASLQSAKDTLSTSAPSVSATHTITFTTTQAIPASGKIVITLQGGSTFGNIAGGSCSNGGSGATSSDLVYECTYGSGLAATSTNSITVVAANPANTSSYDVTVETKNGSGTVIENAGLKVAIVNTVTMSAAVPATLQFDITGTSSGVVINGVTTNATSSATTTPFGTLATTSRVSVGQTLSVQTNATGGFKVTVQQNHDMSNASGATIDGFKDGVSSTTPQNWAAPTGTLDATSTYGHLGLTTDDAALSNGADFSSSKYVGFDGTSPVEVMYHTGPADGSTAGKGRANVAYSVQISNLQEAGDYSNTLTYICTPTY